VKSALGYLCGAPRLSTRPEANACGPRAHMVGVMNGFEKLGWSVQSYIVGDRIPRDWSAAATETFINRSRVRLLCADALRIGGGRISAHRAFKEIDHVDWVYERLASFQALGAPFQRKGIPWILESNALLYAEAKKARKSIELESVARRIEINAYRDCSAIVCISNELGEMIQEASGVPAWKLIVVPNGVDTDFFDPKAHDALRQFPQFTIGFVGGLYDWQGLDRLIDVVHELRQEGKDICITVVGDGLMRSDWEARAKGLGIREYVSFLGQVPWSEVPAYIAGFDVAFCGQVRLQLGTMYGSPLKLYEYASMGKPVIASAFPDAARVISDRSNGFLFDPESKASLKEAICSAWDRRRQLPAMGISARITMESQHSWTVRVQQTITGIQEILARTVRGDFNRKLEFTPEVVSQDFRRA
jgi:glycosyltransferase involved in cell wall biosynthesis